MVGEGAWDSCKVTSFLIYEVYNKLWDLTDFWGERLVQIASKNTLKRIRALKHKKYRDQTRTYFAEGIATVLSALFHKAPIQYVIVCPQLLRGKTAYQALSKIKDPILCYETDAQSFRTISSRDNPVGLGAVISYEDLSPESLDVLSCETYVALDRIRNPGNLGTVIRTADCLGFGVLISGESTDPYSPECLRASMGALYTVPLARFEKIDGLFKWCAQKRVSLVTTSSKAKREVTQVKGYPKPLAVLLGSEGTGLSQEVLETGVMEVKIPMHGQVTSLNLAVAAGIMMYDIINKPRKDL